VSVIPVQKKKMEGMSFVSINIKQDSIINDKRAVHKA
jgi:hypothetical protein